MLRSREHAQAAGVEDERPVQDVETFHFWAGDPSHRLLAPTPGVEAAPPIFSTRLLEEVLARRSLVRRRGPRCTRCNAALQSISCGRGRPGRRGRVEGWEQHVGRGGHDVPPPVGRPAREVPSRRRACGDQCPASVRRPACRKRR